MLVGCSVTRALYKLTTEGFLGAPGSRDRLWCTLLTFAAFRTVVDERGRLCGMLDLLDLV